MLLRFIRWPLRGRYITPWLASHQGWWVFSLGSLAGLGLAAWLSYVVRLLSGDALSRTYSATMVLHSRFPHLAAIGFIWPPLPALAQLPFAIPLEWTNDGFSGGIVTTLAGGALLATLNALLRSAGLPGRWRLLLIVLFALNPMWLFYAGNGMSEMPFLLFFSLTTYCFLRWRATGHWRELMLAGVTTALMFGCRYDAIPYAAVFTATMMGMFLLNRHLLQPARAEAHLLVYLVPFVYGVFLWVYFNWLIMGDALYFLRSNYSNAYLTRDMAIDPEVTALRNSWSLTIRYLIFRTGMLSPLFVALVPVALVEVWRRRDIALMGLLLLTLAAPVFQTVMYRNGQTFGFPRFYMSVQPGALLLAAYLLQRWHGRVHRALLVLTAVALASGIWTSSAAMQQSSQEEDGSFVAAMRNPGETIDNYASDRAVAATLRSRFNDQPVLILADMQAEVVVLFSMMPQRFILLSDLDFEQAVAEPSRYADYVLVGIRTESQREYFALQEQHPDLYEHGGIGLVLDSQLGEFRLYRSVNRRSP